MAKSKITGKTFEEMLSESTELDLSTKFKDIIYEFSNDVHAMGMVVYTYEEGNAKFLFKDPAFTQPVTDYELLAMYLDEVVATRLADENTSLEKCGYFETEKVNFLEYKEDNFVKKFYKIGNYFSGETYFDLNGFVPGDSKYALVDSAIVDKSVVGEEERPAMVTIWEGTYTPAPHGGVYFYTTEDVQSAELLRNVSEVNVTLDGTPYTLPVVFDGGIYTIGELPNTPFTFVYDSVSEPNIVGVATLTEGSHTIKVECTPSPEPPMQTIWEGTFTGEEATHEGDTVYFYEAQDIQNAEILMNTSEVTVTFDGVQYTLQVEPITDITGGGGARVGANDVQFEDYPFIFSYEYENEEKYFSITTQTAGPHTIKVEATDETADEPENPGGGSAIDLPGGEIAL